MRWAESLFLFERWKGGRYVCSRNYCLIVAMPPTSKISNHPALGTSSSIYSCAKWPWQFAAVHSWRIGSSVCQNSIRWDPMSSQTFKEGSKTFLQLLLTFKLSAHFRMGSRQVSMGIFACPLTDELKLGITKILKSGSKRKDWPKGISMVYLALVRWMHRSSNPKFSLRKLHCCSTQEKSVYFKNTQCFDPIYI